MKNIRTQTITNVDKKKIFEYANILFNIKYRQDKTYKFSEALKEAWNIRLFFKKNGF